MNKTTIKIELDTRNGLRQYGRKGQTYDDIVKELLKKGSLNTATLNDFKRSQ